MRVAPNLYRHAVEPKDPIIDGPWLNYVLATGMSDGWLGWPRRFHLLRWWR